MKLPPLRWLAMLTAALLATPVLRAAEEPAPGILFLNLKVKDGLFSLVSVTNAPGVLKARRGVPPHQDFQIVLEDTEGKELWTGWLADPTVQRLEYEDPARPGEIQLKEVRVSEAECSVRLPAKSGRRHLAIYRRPSAQANTPPGRRPPTRELVSRLALPAETKP